MSSDFRAIIQAQLNDESVENEVKAIGSKHQIVFNNISFDRTALSNAIQSALNGQNININLGNANFNTQNLSRQAEQIGNSIGRNLGQSATSQLNRVLISNNPQSIWKMQESLRGLGMSNSNIKSVTKDIENLWIAINKITTNIQPNGNLSLNIRGVDSFGNVVNVIRQYDKEANLVTTTNTKITQSFDANAKQIQINEAAITKYLTKLDEMQLKAINPNETKFISNIDSLDTLSTKYNYVRDTIESLRTADSQSAITIRANIESEINSFDGLIKTLRNAEYAASQLRAKPLETVKQDELNKLREFMAIVKNSGISLDLFTKSRQALKEFLPSNTGIKDIQIVLKNVTNTEQLTQYLNLFSNVKSEFKALQAEQQPVNQAYKEMLSLQEQINSKSAKVKSLDASKNIKEIEQLGNEIKALQSKYDKLSDTFGKKLTVDQTNTLANKLAELEDKESMVNAKLADATNIKQINAQYQETLSLISQISAKNSKMLSLNPEKDTQQIAELNVQIGSLWQRLTELSNVKFSTEQITAIDDASLRMANSLAVSESRLTDIQNNLVNTINGKISGGSINASIDQVQSKFNTLNSTISSLGAGANTDVLKAKLLEINTDLEQLNSLKAKFAEGGMDNAALISSYDSYNKILDRVKNNLKSVQIETKQFASATEVRIAINQMETWLRKNSKAAKTYGNEIRNLINNLKQMQAQGGVLPTDLKRITNGFMEIKTAAAAAGLTGRTIFEQFMGAAKSLSRYFSSAWLVSLGFRGLRSMYENVLKVDTAMTDLYRITNLSTEQYTRLYDKMTDSAKKYGVALNDIIAGTANWVRYGFSDTDLSKELAEITAMYQHVADLDNKTATQNLLTAYKGFEQTLTTTYNGNVSSAMEHIADVYDKLNNELPVSAAQVAEGVNKAASVLQEAGTSFEQASALIVGGGSVTQDFDSMGNAIKIATLRIHGMKGKLEELGEEVDDNISSVSKIQTQILNLTHGKVNIFEDDGESFRNVYDVFHDIANVWDTLKDTESAELLETIAGKNRSNQIMALIQNWETVEKAVKAANNATGTAREEQERYMNSLQGHIDSLNASLQATSNTILKSDFLKDLVNLLNVIVNGLDFVIGKLGTIPTLIGTITAVLSAKNFGRDKRFSLK